MYFRAIVLQGNAHAWVKEHATALPAHAPHVPLPARVAARTTAPPSARLDISDGPGD